MRSPKKDLQSDSRPVASKWNLDDVGRGHMGRWEEEGREMDIFSDFGLLAD